MAEERFRIAGARRQYPAVRLARLGVRAAAARDFASANEHAAMFGRESEPGAPRAPGLILVADVA